MDDLCNIEDVFERHFSMVYRLSYSYLGSAADAEDAAQSVFMKLIRKPRAFKSQEHEKAWLIVCTSNHCKDVLKSAHRTRVYALPERDHTMFATEDASSDTMEAVLRLPNRLKDCVYLHYYEGYKTAEIGRLLGIPASTVRNRLREARLILREELGGDTA